MPFDDLRPTVSLSITGTPVGGNALAFISSIRVELALDKADLITMVVQNPILDKIGEQRTSGLAGASNLAWAPGQLVELGFSYGDAEPKQLFAGVINKWMPRFPRTGIPTLTLKAMDGSAKLMDGPGATDARTFDEGITLSEMAMLVLLDHGIDIVDVGFHDAEPAVVTVKKAGMSDYSFVRGIANILGWEFYINWDPSVGWKAFMGEPVADEENKKRFVWGPDFEQGDGDGILLDFSPEFAVQGVSTDVEVYYFDRDTMIWEKVIYPEAEPDRKETEPTWQWAGDESTMEEDLQAVGDPDSARGIRIKAGGVSVEVIPMRGFKSAEEAYIFAKAWWISRQNLLIRGKGTIIGFPDLLPGQVHELGGLGAGLDGPWYFSEVTHDYRRGSAFTTSFVARKVIP